MGRIESYEKTVSVPVSRKSRSYAITAIVVILWFCILQPYPSRSPTLWPLSRDEAETTKGSEGFDWLDVPSRKHLEFHSCYDAECARLELPLDYFNGSNPDKTISLAVVRIPAKVPVTDPRYGGPILINPGGPGGSGTVFAWGAGSLLQDIVDSNDVLDGTPEESESKYYDIIGFDPRGIGATSPGGHCFRFASTRESWGLRLNSEGIVGSSNAALGRRWAMSHALGSSCLEASEGDHDIKAYMTTASVARDMVELTEALGKWRHEEALTLTVREEYIMHEGAGIPIFDEFAVPDRLVYKPGQEKLQYWGLSYGTLLGATFASMFPHRVGRFILDGVVNGPNYMQSLWSDNLADTEKAMQQFYDGCATAGPIGCKLAAEGDTATDVQKKSEVIIESLYHTPLPLPGPEPEVLTYSDLKYVIFGGLYSPIQMFPAIGEFLANVADGDASDFAMYLDMIHSYSCKASDGQAQTAKSDGEAQVAIACGDGPPLDHYNITEYDHFWKALAEQSPTAGAIWANFRMVCAGWKIRPKYRFTGHFGGTTSSPILWIGNTADPVTPVISAHKMAAKFPGSVVLTQDSPGHCSLAAASICTLSAIRAYFHNGTLPDPDTVCSVQNSPFDTPSIRAKRAEALSTTELNMLETHEGVGRIFSRSGFGFGQQLAQFLGAGGIWEAF